MHCTQYFRSSEQLWRADPTMRIACQWTEYPQNIYVEVTEQCFVFLPRDRRHVV